MVNMVTQSNLFATASALVEALGFKEPTQFITDPATNPPPEPEPDPAELAVQAQQQIESMKLEIERQRLELDRFKAMGDLKVKELSHEVDIHKVNLEGAQAEMDDPWSMLDSLGGENPGALVAAVDQALLSVINAAGGETLQ